MLNQKALAGFPILLWQRISVTEAPGARPSPPPHFQTPKPSSFLSISNPEGGGFAENKQQQTKDQSGARSADGGAEGELLCEIIARNNFKQMSVWTWPWARVPVKYSDLIGKQAV